MRFLCMCQGGNSRSVACAYVLKYEYQMDALACSWEKNSPATLAMLLEWTDVVIVMQDKFKHYIPKNYWKKLVVVDVGEDVWCNGLHPDLIQKCRDLLKSGLNVGVQDEIDLHTATVSG